MVIRGYLGEEGRVRFHSMTRAGKQNAVRNGFLMQKAHYGYRHDPDQKGVQVIDADTSAKLLWIYRSVAGGMTAGQVARDLNRRALRPLVARARRDRNLLVDVPPPAKAAPRRNLAPVRRAVPFSKRERRALRATFRDGVS